MFTESLDEGNEDFTDIYDFSCLDPDEPAVITTFDSVKEALDFCTVNYHASNDKYVLLK